MTNNILNIRPAQVSDSNVLSELAYRSKSYWGYSDEFMASCRDELRVTAEKLVDKHYVHFVGALGEEVVAFYAFEKLSSIHYDLHALFVEPAYIGKGFGKQLMAHAKTLAMDACVKTISVQSDPQAADFYRALGAVKIGERESGSIPGRFLPELEWRLS